MFDNDNNTLVITYPLGQDVPKMFDNVRLAQSEFIYLSSLRLEAAIIFDLSSLRLGDQSDLILILRLLEPMDKDIQLERLAKFSSVIVPSNELEERIKHSNFDNCQRLLGITLLSLFSERFLAALDRRCFPTMTGWIH